LASRLAPRSSVYYTGDKVFKYDGPLDARPGWTTAVPLRDFEMKAIPIALVLSAISVVTPALLAGCTGDDNSLPLPPSDAGGDAKSDAAKGDATTKSDAAHDASEPTDDSAAESDAGDSSVSDAVVDSGAASEAATDATPADASPADAGSTD
jgi:hypothetical protein